VRQVKTSKAIGTAFILLAISGLIIYLGKLTLDKLDSGQWGMAVLGAAATIFVFAGLVAIIKNMGRKDGEDKGGEVEDG